MQALKGLVVGLGVLIVISFGLLIYGIVAKIADPEFKVVAEKAGAPPAAPASFGEVRLALPAGCTVVDMQTEGERLFLRTGPAGVCERIVIVDVATGQPLGTLVVAP